MKTWFDLGFCFPRIRGDVPTVDGGGENGILFSPHTRGCSADFTTLEAAWAVFPAYAGMFLFHVGSLYATSGFPRIRGDVPSVNYLGVSLKKFSPHTRGCSFSQLTR